MKRSLPLFVLVACAALIVVAVACGDDADVGATTESIQDVANDEALAEQALLTVSDLGAGWSSEPRDDEDDPERDAIFETVMNAESACSAVVAEAERQGVSLSELDIVPDAPARAESPTLLLEPDLMSDVEHTVSVYPTADDAAATFSLVADTEYAGCVAAFFDDALQALYDAYETGIVVTDYTSSQNPVGFGDDAFHIRIEVTLEAPDGSNANMALDMSAVLSGRVVSALTQTSFENELNTAAISAAAFEKVKATFELT